MITTLSSWVGLRLYFHAGCHSWRVSAQDSDSAFVAESAILIPATEANAPLRPYFPRWPVVATFLGGWWRAAAAGSLSSTRVARQYATAICRTTARPQNAPRYETPETLSPNAFRAASPCSAVAEQPLHRLPVSPARVRHLRFGCPNIGETL